LVAADPERAVDLLMSAARQGYAPSMHHISLAYRDGLLGQGLTSERQDMI
jgi:TPR repeat protein